MTDHSHLFQAAPLQRIEQYWLTLAQGGAVPKRSAVDPRQIEMDLEYAFVGERIAPGMMKLRVAGSHLSDLMGMDTSGMPLSALFCPGARAPLSDGVSHFFAKPGITRFAIKGEGGLGKPQLTGALMLAPLLSDDGQMTRVLGGLVTVGRIGRTPRRFELEHRSHRLLADLPKAIAPEPVSAFAEASRPFVGAPKSEPSSKANSKRPYLRLIVSNDD